MSLSIPKLQRLWKLRLSPPSWLSKRCDQIEKIAALWDDEPALDFTPTQSAEDEEIPTGNWDQVMTKLRAYYERHVELKHLSHQIDQVSDLFQIKHRHHLLRVVSANHGDTDDESDTTTCTPKKAESFFASYNYPFEIVRFYQSCKTVPPSGRLTFHKPHRFISKFVWMLSNRQKILPILSLQSFWGLSHLLREAAAESGLKDLSHDLATLPFDQFIAVWPRISDGFVQKVTGISYVALTQDEKRQLWRMMLAASVESSTTKNAFDMLQTGNHALILYGPPGTGKTFEAKRIAEQMLGLDGQGMQARQFGKLTPASAAQDGCWELVQFHPSYTYQDFMGGIQPALKGDTLNYTLNPGVFLRFCEAAKISQKRFVLIIDEINRADLSAVFGELLYALEYRGQTVQVTHFGPFQIPENVYIIGTMNTADKSLTTFDLALRRRFTFMKLPPDLECLMEWGDATGFRRDEMAALIKRGKILNDYLTQSQEGPKLPADFAIGQAYFMKVVDFCPLEADGEGRSLTPFALEQLWDYHLEPLIEEYLGADAGNHRNALQDRRKAFMLDLPADD